MDSLAKSALCNPEFKHMKTALYPMIFPASELDVPAGSKFYVASWKDGPTFMKHLLVRSASMLRAYGAKAEKGGPVVHPVFKVAQDGSILYDKNNPANAGLDAKKIRGGLILYGFSGFHKGLEVEEKDGVIIAKTDPSELPLDVCQSDEGLKRYLKKAGYELVNDPKKADFVLNWQLTECIDGDRVGPALPTMLPLATGMSSGIDFGHFDSNINQFSAGYINYPSILGFHALSGFLVAAIFQGNLDAGVGKEFLLIDRRRFDPETGKGVFWGKSFWSHVSSALHSSVPSVDDRVDRRIASYIAGRWLKD